MNGRSMWGLVARFGLIVGVVMMNYGCELNKPEPQKDTQAESSRNKAYNLKFVACSPDKMVDVEIKNGQVAPRDQFIFVCVGDKIRWFTDDDSSFTTQFDVTKAAKNNDLFESGLATIPSKPDTCPAVSGKHHKQVTDAQTITANATPFKGDLYT